MTEEKRPKVLALYQAVLALLDEGADINAMKVSDITDRAGIGKGTAYDYFKSKEEIIASALSYDMERKVQTELARMNSKEHFLEKVHYLFDWVSRQHQEQKAFTRFLRLTTQKCEVSRGLLEELEKKKREGCTPIRIMVELCREGKDAGEIRADIPAEAACLKLLADLAAFAMYLEQEEKMEACDQEWMKEFLYQSVCKSLT